MSILPCNNLQHGGVWKRESGRALWQAVSSPKWCCHTQLHPRMPQMWPADSICEGEWQDKKHAQEARWKDMSQNKLGHQIKPAASFEASHRQTTQLGQQNHGTTAKNPQKDQGPKTASSSAALERQLHDRRSWTTTVAQPSLDQRQKWISSAVDAKRPNTT